jgi:hypothetical protein
VLVVLGLDDGGGLGGAGEEAEVEQVDGEADAERPSAIPARIPTQAPNE